MIKERFQEINLRNVMCITHNDLDGHGSVEGLNSFLMDVNSKEDREYQIPTLSDYNPTSVRTVEMAKEILEGNEDKKFLFVMDRSLNNEDLKQILSLRDDLNVIYIDHHLNTVKEEFDNDERFFNFLGAVHSSDVESKKSAAELVVDFCELFLLDSKKISLSDWVDVKFLMSIIGDWDTFRWKTLEGGFRKKLVLVLSGADKILGSKETFDLIKESNNGKLILDSDKSMEALNVHYTIYKENLDKLYQEAYQDVKETGLSFGKDGIKVAFLDNPDPKYFSIVSSKLFENKVASIIIGVYDTGIVSARGDYFDNPINLQSLMSKLPGGGGGHYNAAGGLLLSKRLTDEEALKLKAKNPKIIESFKDTIIGVLKENIK